MANDTSITGHLSSLSATTLLPGQDKRTFVERELRQVIDAHTQVGYEFFYPKDSALVRNQGLSFGAQFRKID